MTKEGLARLQGAAKERKSARKPESVAAPGELSAGIVRELRRLGAKPVRTPKIPEEAQSWPAPIRSLLYGYSWPKGKSFGNDEDLDNHMWSIEFEPASVDFDEFEGCRG